MTDSAAGARLAAFQELASRFAYARDNRDEALLRECYAHDAENGSLRGRDAVVGNDLRVLAARKVQLRHVLSNFFVLENGEREAVFQAYVTVFAVPAAAHLLAVGTHRYHVRLDDGEWKVVSRTVTMDTTTFDPAVLAPAG